MMKLVVRFLLSCCFLFLGGYAHPSQDEIDASTLAAAVQTDQDFIIPAAPSNPRNEFDPLKATEEEEDDDDDDETKSSKKHSGAGNGDVASFYTPASGYLSHGLSGRLPFCEHLSTSASKFIIHCVFRI